MKLHLSFLAALSLFSGAAFGSVALNFNLEFDSGVPSGFSDTGGVATNGMIWGILIDADNNGFAGSYDFSSPLDVKKSYVLSSSGGISDDVLWTAENRTADTTGSVEGVGGITGGAGGFYDIGGVAYDVGNGVAAGDRFYVVWFNGGKGGVLSDPSFLLPSDGNSSAFGDPFVGIDPNRSAGLAYLGTGSASTGSGIQVNLVPEPSSVLLGLLGALGLLRRKRN